MSTTPRITLPAAAPTMTGSPPTAARAEPMPGRPARNAPQTRKKPKTRWILGVSAVAVLAVGTLWLRGGSSAEAGSAESFTVELRSLPIALTEKGELKAKNSVDIKCEIEGRTRILSLIPEGKIVQHGDLLVELASDQIEEKLQAERLKETSAIAAKEAAEKEYDIQLDENASNIRKGELAVTIANLNLEKYTKGDWMQQLQDANLTLERAHEQLRRATEKFADSEELAAKNFISQLDLDDDRFRKYEAEIELQKAQLAKEILEKYTNQVDFAQKQSDLHEAEKELERIKKTAEANAATKLANRESKTTELAYIQKQIAKYEEQLANCKIYAPSSGFVVYYNEGGRWWGNESQIREGAEVHERQTILTIPDPSVMTVVLRIHEAKVDKVQLDQKALVEVEGVPGVTFTGQITKIAMLADSRNRWLNPDLKEYETEITLDPTDVELKPGATAKAQIMVDRLDDVLAVPVQSIFSKQGRHFVFLDRGAGKGEPVPVQLGVSNTNYVQIRDGLRAGQTILLAVSDDLKRLIPDEESNGEPGMESVPRMMRRAGPPGRVEGQGRPGSPGGDRKGNAAAAPST